MSKPSPTKPTHTGAAEFWKAYFTKFRRHIEDHEVSETAPAPLAAHTEPPPPAQPSNTPRKRGLPRL